MESLSKLMLNLVFIFLALASLGRTQTSACPSNVAAAGSDMSQTLCDSGGGGNVNGTGGTAFVPRKAAKMLKRQDGLVANFSLLIEEYPYQVSPYLKPASVLRGCTGSIVTTYDTEDANLKGKGQTVVSQRRSCGSTGPIELFSGLGNSVQVVEEDIYYNGWIIHITDGYFTIPTLLSSTLRTIGGTGLFANDTVSSISAFDFVPSITAFIPSDSAFATALRCSQGSTATTNALALLRATIVRGSVVYSPLLVDGAFFESINGDDITVTVTNGTKYVNGARIVQEDIVIQNGVVHIVDGLVSNTGLHCPPPPVTTTPISSATLTATTTIVISNPATITITNTTVVTTILTVATPATTILTIKAPSTTVLTVTNPTADVSTVTILNTTISTITKPTTIVSTDTITSVMTITKPATTVLTDTITNVVTVTKPTTSVLTDTSLIIVSSIKTILTTSQTTSILTPTPPTTYPTTLLSTTSTPLTTQPPPPLYQSSNIVPSAPSPTTSCPESEIPYQGHGPSGLPKESYQPYGPLHSP